ncbi:MAG: 30S ribosomal protein S17 [Candidatus Zambryskibacteria bacterium CG10_big_fil_rev_8_21_14_0_10_42_12]|uniref:Small ribosomal subunit protein uS17 n=1 Tax=Candidatus Zambryskibacteria bacterium CG10_big_fil_rev_8_21_14_0_10_42_12 TaxID=1975115 RepID=A0A2H0QWG8_9BACT|nr:MAG: 30S ribosomal protein S17 [Candidatus Zambryskibacteria bacterium CG10_big_fil_rev_8_21_14_0_10_42_12]
MNITQKGGRQFRGTVVSNKMKDTIVVSVERYVKHPKIGKYMRLRKKFKVHDAGNTKSVGDQVTIKEIRPISKDKHFTIV